MNLAANSKTPGDLTGNRSVGLSDLNVVDIKATNVVIAIGIILTTLARCRARRGRVCVHVVVVFYPLRHVGAAPAPRSASGARDAAVQRLLLRVAGPEDYCVVRGRGSSKHYEKCQHLGGPR